MPTDRKRASRPPVVLVVLDGWGYRAERDGNAIALANTPAWDALWNTGSYPRTLLAASGLAVGLPEGQMGNSEVGHLNLGAGRVVPQDIVRISTSIRDGSFFANEALVRAMCAAREHGGTVHLMGLIGPGGVHALDEHLLALVEMASRLGVPRVAIHALLDGRDTMPRSALGYMRELLERTRGRAEVASLGGRYFGMDRDRRWPRTERWYRAAVEGIGPRVHDPVEAIEAAYERGETDEFITPAVVERNGAPIAPMRDGDAVVFFNFRADRMRQIVRALTQEGFDDFDVSGRPRVHAVTMTQYDATFTVPVAFPPFSLARIVAQVLSDCGMTQFRTAETEKYAHVTYFFNGGIEPPYPGEERLLVPSQQVATYDLAPEMSAPGITDVLCGAIERREHDFILCNYANGDMVGHTGVMPAVLRAVETVDACLQRVLDAADRTGTRVIVTADHGNCEMMIDPESGGPHTAHTTNPVPLVIVDRDDRRALRDGGALCDVGPTILTMLDVDRPPEMTGTDLRVRGTHP
ncbi:MAG TPA: 2,3-bisphosphoglycerate-independent phosphoglycerate mutase [Gemmatimonadaceae bacterium]|nr:2,3-bisphosphoglycerate-independent phosphoglycerate mutase [Gemmatimonadaceae bacterium]